MRVTLEGAPVTSMSSDLTVTDAHLTIGVSTLEEDASLADAATVSTQYRGGVSVCVACVLCVCE